MNGVHLPHFIPPSDTVRSDTIHTVQSHSLSVTPFIVSTLQSTLSAPQELYSTAYHLVNPTFIKFSPVCHRFVFLCSLSFLLSFIPELLTCMDVGVRVGHELSVVELVVVCGQDETQCFPCLMNNCLAAVGLPVHARHQAFVQIFYLRRNMFMITFPEYRHSFRPSRGIVMMLFLKQRRNSCRSYTRKGI